MMNEFRITGLMSVYKNEKAERLINSLDSILAQTVSLFEFVLIEDGYLPNELLDVINDYEKKFIKKNISFISLKNKTNLGLGKSLNKGIAVATGDLIARFDSDDISESNRMELTLSEFKKNPDLSLVGGNIKEFDYANENFSQMRIVPNTNDEIKKKIIRSNPFNHMAVTFKKNDILNVGSYEDVPYFEDYYLWFKLIRSDYLAKNVDIVLVNACVDSDFFERRSGYQYFLKEINFQNIIFSKKYINLFQYLHNVLFRGGSRLLPKKLITKIYSIMRK